MKLKPGDVAFLTDVVMQEIIKRGAEERQMYCANEDRVTRFVVLTHRDLVEIQKKTRTIVFGDFKFTDPMIGLGVEDLLMGIPIFGNIVEASKNILLGKHWICATCGYKEQR